MSPWSSCWGWRSRAAAALATRERRRRPSRDRSRRPPRRRSSSWPSAPACRDVKRRLRRAGLFPVEVDLGLDHTGAIEVRHVDAIDFRTQAAINKYKAFLANFFRAKPDGFTSRTFGKRLYWTGDEQPLTAAQLRNFRRIVRIGQGQGSS